MQYSVKAFFTTIVSIGKCGYGKEVRLVLVNVRKASKKINGLSGHFCRATYVYRYGLLSGDLKSGLLCQPMILVVGLLFLLLKALKFNNLHWSSPMVNIMHCHNSSRIQSTQWFQGAHTFQIYFQGHEAIPYGKCKTPLMWWAQHLCRQTLNSHSALISHVGCEVKSFEPKYVYI